MMYCSVEEAFNNPLKEKMEEYQINNNINSNTNNNDDIIQTVENNQDKYNIDSDVIQHPVFVPSFFTAQGDYANKGPYYEDEQVNHENNNNNNINMMGTTIDDLKDQDVPQYNSDNDLDDVFSSDDSLSFLDSDCSLSPQQLEYLSDDIDNDYYRKPKNKQPINHEYYITKFMRTILDDTMSNGIESMNGSSNSTNGALNSASSDVYDHVKSCKYCRSKISKKIKAYYSTEATAKSTAQSSILGLTNIEGFTDGKLSIPKNILLGYELKEIIIIIIVGIILIFVLDLFVKIGRKTLKLKK
jgi:hypothetical protein